MAIMQQHCEGVDICILYTAYTFHPFNQPRFLFLSVFGFCMICMGVASEWLSGQIDM